MERLYNILNEKYNTNQGPRIWALNFKYCVSIKGDNTFACVKYSYTPIDKESPFSVEAIKKIDQYGSMKAFSKAYRDERVELLESNADDLRIKAIWQFSKSVNKGDIFIYGYGHSVYGYFVVTGEEASALNDEEDVCYHFWDAEKKMFDYPLDVDQPFESPFFKLYDRDHMKSLLKALKGKL